MDKANLNSNAPPASSPLTIGVEGDHLVIRIGVSTLAFCFENNLFDDDANDFRREFQVVDHHKFAKGVVRGLLDEREDGSTLLTAALDAACVDATENNEGVDDDGRLVNEGMLHRFPCIRY